MNIHWKQLFSTLLISVSLPVMADRAQDEAHIREVITRTNAAYTRQDAETMASFLAEDFETWDGIKGRKDVSKAWANENIHYRQPEELGIRFITDEVAVFKECGEAWDVARQGLISLRERAGALCDTPAEAVARTCEDPA